MIYLGNGIWSDSGSSLSHGGPWKDHKYIAIKNGRYIYPDDKRPKINQVDNKPYGLLEGKYRMTMGSSTRENGTISYGFSKHKPYKTITGESLSGQIDFNKKQQEVNDVLDTQDKNGTSVSVTKYAKRPDGKNPPGVGDKQHTIGKYPQQKSPRNNTISKTRFYGKNKKFKKAVSSQGPSQAELAQRGMMKGSSKNVGTGSKTVQYQKKLSDTNKTYQKAVSSQGPSAAEKAQREKGSKKKPQSKNVNSGKPNKKKKNPFKQLAKWIKGEPGKVSVH